MEGARAIREHARPPPPLLPPTSGRATSTTRAVTTDPTLDVSTLVATVECRGEALATWSRANRDDSIGTWQILHDACNFLSMKFGKQCVSTMPLRDNMATLRALVAPDALAHCICMPACLPGRTGTRGKRSQRSSGGCWQRLRETRGWCPWCWRRGAWTSRARARNSALEKAS